MYEYAQTLNHDPWNEHKKDVDEDVCDFILEYPATCMVRYDFENFCGRLFPLSVLCALVASLKAIELAYEAYTDAMDGCDLWIGTPLHFACSYKAEPAIVQYLIKKQPAMLERTNQFGRTSLHVACVFKASTMALSYLLGRYPEAAKRCDKDGCTPLHLACENACTSITGNGGGILIAVNIRTVW
jgi:hypothetical protein